MMAGFDSVDPAYACVLPVSLAAPLFCRHTTIPPNSPITTQYSCADWIGGMPDPNEILHLQAGVAG
jgi:hypothetical protein